MAVTWLHTSDLHVRNDDSYDRRVVLRALVGSVARLRKRGERAADLIFATGDIAHSGRPEEYAVATRFLDELLEAAGLSRTHLYVVPGNHDVDRVIGNQLTRTLYSRNEADVYFAPGAKKLHLIEKLGSFLRWHRSYFDGIRTMPDDSTCGPVELVDVRGHRLGILPINTALFCQDDSDHEKLFVGRRCLEAALQELKTFDTHLKIVLMHHPLHFLSWFECQHIEAALIDDVDIVLSGHVHAAGIKNVQMSNGRNLLCSAGATYQTRDWPNTAYYATFEGSQVRIFPICYVDRSREMWALDTGLAPAPPFELSYPVPREPDFRTFRLPGLRRSEVVASLAALAEAQEAPDEPELSKRAIAVKGNRNTTANRGPKR